MYGRQAVRCLRLMTLLYCHDGKFAAGIRYALTVTQCRQGLPFESARRALVQVAHQGGKANGKVITLCDCLLQYGKLDIGLTVRLF